MSEPVKCPTCKGSHWRWKPLHPGDVQGNSGELEPCPVCNPLPETAIEYHPEYEVHSTNVGVCIDVTA